MAKNGLHPKTGCEKAADFCYKHDRIARLEFGIEFFECIHNRALEESAFL